MKNVLEKMRDFCNKLDVKVILPAADHPGMLRVYSHGKTAGQLFPAATPVDTVKYG
jgi:hypothetical protein